MDADKEDFYRNVAKRLAASTLLYRVDAIVHVEAQDDIRFWSKILNRFRPGNYKFLPASMNEYGNMTSGCTQCLKYRDHLSKKFFICIDSDLRYLLGEDISAYDGILQTYTYSWENHHAFAKSLNRRYKEVTGKNNFNFELFLSGYSAIVYKPLLFMLYNERNHLDFFNREDFRKCITVTFVNGNQKSDGLTMLRYMSRKFDRAVSKIYGQSDFDFQEEAHRYAQLGLREDNAYLYVRGHCIYNTLVSIGHKLCEKNNVNFERDILLKTLEFEYEEMQKISRDIKRLNSLREKI